MEFHVLNLRPAGCWRLTDISADFINPPQLNLAQENEEKNREMVL